MIQISTNTPNSFARYTLKHRFPLVVQGVINTYDYLKCENLKSFLEEIKGEEISPINVYKGCPRERIGYARAINKIIAENDYTWNNVPFLLIENYLYHKLAELCSKDNIEGDYFSASKTKGLKDAKDNIKTTYAVYQNLWYCNTADSFKKLLHLNLMGNRADLSQNTDSYVIGDRESALLINKTSEVEKCISNIKRVDIVLDNAGEELFADLLLAHWFLCNTQVEQVVFHFKTMPYFVSDATFEDFYILVDFLRNKVGLQEFADYISTDVKLGRIQLLQDEFWCSHYTYRHIPEHIQSVINSSDLFVYKGDLNYRKLVGDMMWDYTTPTDSIVNYLNVDALILRVLKSEVIVGLTEDNIPSEAEKGWMYNGKYAIVDFCERRD